MVHDRIMHLVLESILSCSSFQKSILPAPQCKASNQPNTNSFLLLIQPLDFTFYKVLSVLNIMMTWDSLFLSKTALLSTFSLLNTFNFYLLKNLSRQKKSVYVRKTIH